AAVLDEFFGGAIRFRSARAEGALVHLAAMVEGAGFRELGSAERAGQVAVAAAYALVLAVKNNAVLGVIKAVGRAYRHAGRIGAARAGDGKRDCSRLTIVYADQARLFRATLFFVFVLAGSDATHEVNAALGNVKAVRTGCHVVLPPHNLAGRNREALVSCIIA